MPEPVTLEDLEDDALQRKDEAGDGDADMQDAAAADPDLDDEILSLSTADILTRKRLLENDSRIMKSEFTRLSHEKSTMGEKIKENQDKITNNRWVGKEVGGGGRMGGGR
jgi:26S proteasome regulatory subunit T5